MEQQIIKSWYLSNHGMAVSKVELHDSLMNVLLPIDNLSLLVTYASMDEGRIVQIKSDKIRF